MGTRHPFVVGEWYHCYNRGVDKRRVFESKAEYGRFLLYMYVSNNLEPVHVSDLKYKYLNEVFFSVAKTGDPIVEIGAYCLLPNHFHFLLKEVRKGGIALFMQKILTGYTMYFNKKRERTGALFGSTFKSKHIVDDRYLKYLVSYIHLNPVELYEPQWKEGGGDIRKIEKFLKTYNYSSLPAFYNSERYERKLLGSSVFELFDTLPPVKTMLTEAQEYYQLGKNGKV